LALIVHRHVTDLLVVLVAGSAAAVVLVYCYVDLRPVLGLPTMYEPAWFP